MKLFKIKARISGNILFELNCNSFKICLEKAVSTGAYLRGAYLGDADLRGAYLRGAYLGGAYLGDADGEKIKIKKIPLQILGLHWDIIIFDSHMKIGCEFHSIKKWNTYSDNRISEMNGYALEFWKKSKEFIMAFCEANDRK
jgi:uncharacterized protein YjbI with pentapeptide repeats